MARPPQFPITIKAGATAIKIYRSPQQVKVAPKANARPASGRKAKVVTYDSYVVVHYRGGNRQRQRFKSLELAQTEAARVRASLLNEDSAGLQITGTDLVAYNQACHIAKGFGISPDQLAKEYATARKILGEVSILEAAHFFDRYGKTVKEKRTVPEVVEELLTGLKADNKSSYHIKDMERRLRTFAKEFIGPITNVETKNVSEWLRNLKGEDNAGKDIIYAPKTRNHYRNAVVQLFNYARDQGYLPKGMPTEIEGVKALTVVPPQNEIFTVEEMTKLLNNSPDWLVPSLAIKAFSGVRTEEILRMHWSALNFETKHITLSADVTKTKQRRLIPMPDNLVAWMELHRGKVGRICGRWGRPQAFVQAFERVGQRLGVKVGANRFRNSYITYRVAVTHDIQRVSLESGNSPKVIQREYLELATESDGKRWFEIRPSVSVAGRKPEARQPNATRKPKPKRSRRT